MTKSTKTQTPMDIVRASLATREAVVSTRQGELTQVQARNADHEVKRHSGALDYDALGHIEDQHREEGLQRFVEAQSPHLEVERQAVASFELEGLLTDHLGQRHALEDKRGEAVAVIRQALSEYDEAVTTYNEELTEHIGTARRAGLIEGRADPTLPVLMGGGEYGHPRALIVSGERFVQVRADLDSVVREARR